MNKHLPTLITLCCCFHLWCCSKSALPPQSSLHIKRHTSQPKNVHQHFYVSLDRERFCNIFACEENLSAMLEERRKKFQHFIDQIHQHLNFSSLAKPDLVFLKTDVLSEAPNFISYGQNSSQRNHRAGPSFRGFMVGNFLPAIILPQDTSVTLYKADEYLHASINHGFRKISHIDLDISQMIQNSEYLLSYEPYLSHQFVTILNKIFHRKVDFTVSSIQEPRHWNQSEYIIHYHDRLATKENNQNFPWSSHGIIMERKSNTLIYLISPESEFKSFDNVTVELMQALWGYYHFDRRSSSSKTTTLTSDHLGARLGGGLGDQSTTVKPSQLSGIFRPDYHTLKREPLLYSPEIYYLLFQFDLIAATIAKTLDTPNSRALDLFQNSRHATRLFEQWKTHPRWEFFEEKFITHGFITSPISILLFAYQNYSALDLESLQKLEDALNTFYQDKMYSLSFLGSKPFITKIVDNTFHKHFPFLIDFLPTTIIHWLMEKNGRSFSENMRVFSYIIEDTKRKLNTHRFTMITRKIYPYYEMMATDETVIYYLSILGIDHGIYEDYLMQKLNPIEKSRCLYSKNYTENLLESYQTGYAMATIYSPEFICARLMNIQKELLRHSMR